MNTSDKIQLIHKTLNTQRVEGNLTLTKDTTESRTTANILLTGKRFNALPLGTGIPFLVNIVLGSSREHSEARNRNKGVEIGKAEANCLYLQKLDSTR